jgi:hypothetical protein
MLGWRRIRFTLGISIAGSLLLLSIARALTILRV